MARLSIPVLVLALLLPATARAQGLDDVRSFLERWKKESAIERHVALAEVRGSLGLYRKPRAPDWKARSHGKGRLELVAGVPVLRLEGTPEEMGEQHGSLVGDEARALAESYLPAFLGGKAELEKARRRARDLFERHLTDDERTEIAAFARASGIARDDVLLAQSFTDLYRVWGCSTIGATGPAVAGGEPLLARNLDFVDMGFLHRYACVVVAKPAGKKPFVSVSWPGLIGVLSGQNDSVALAVMVVHGGETCRSGVPFQLAFRRALETARTATDVQSKLEALPLTVTNNLTIVDASGGARVLELTPHGIVARTPDERGRVTSTNHFVSRELRESRFSLTYLSSRRRLEAVERTCDRVERITVPVAIEALRAAAPPRLNLQAMIFCPRSGDLWVALGDPPAAKGAWVKLEAWALLPRAPRAD